MSPLRSLLVAMVAVVLLIGAQPLAWKEQFPRGLMSSEPRGGGGGSCRIETRPLSFPAYDSLTESAVTAVAQVIYFCGEGNTGGGGGGGGDGRGGGPPRGGGPGSRTAQNQGIRIEMAQGGNNSFQPRGMTGPGGVDLEYNIYLDATFQTVWGDGTLSTEVYLDLHPPLGRPVIVPVFGRIFGRQDVPAGQYIDNVAVRIVF